MLPILYQDDDLVVINKPSGLLVHRSAIDRQATEFALQMVRDQLGKRVYPVHRLDRPTSGALVFAFSSAGARQLATEFSEGRVAKTYLAIVRGTPPDEAIIDYALQEELDAKADAWARTDKPSQPAVTVISTLATIEFPVKVDKYPSSRYALVKAQPKTGRKHQIRRHLRHMGHPIIGDVAHGSGKHNRFFRETFQINRLLLACTELSFLHPRAHKMMIVKAPLSEDFQALVERMGWGARIG